LGGPAFWLQSAVRRKNIQHFPQKSPDETLLSIVVQKGETRLHVAHASSGQSVMSFGLTDYLLQLHGSPSATAHQTLQLSTSPRCLSSGTRRICMECRTQNESGRSMGPGGALVQHS
jgi:hypothetical protein